MASMPTPIPNPGPSPDTSGGVVAFAGIIGPPSDEPLDVVALSVVGAPRCSEDRMSLLVDADVCLALAVVTVESGNIPDVGVGGDAVVVGDWVDISVVVGAVMVVVIVVTDGGVDIRS